MDAVVMCGGEGSRLRAGGISTEKPLVRVGDKPMLDRICAALAESRIDTVYAAVSPAAPATREHARELPCTVIETPGDGYVEDLDRVLSDVDCPVLTVAADLPLLTAAVVNRVLAVAAGEKNATVTDQSGATAGDQSDALNRVPSLTVCVPAALKRQLGASVDTTVPLEAIDAGSVLPDSLPDPLPELAPAGVNVVAGEEDLTWVSYDARLAVNVNRPGDLDLAETLCP
jgi:adenosylcobinamide-phosphate guanylyltransferase